MLEIEEISMKIKMKGNSHGKVRINVLLCSPGIFGDHVQTAIAGMGTDFIKKPARR